MTITLRPLTEDDRELNFSIYASTRRDEFLAAGLSPDQVEALTRMQSEAQIYSYANDFPNAEWSVILRDNVPIGRLIIERRSHEILGIDIALISDVRNQGIGSQVIGRLLAEARQTGIPFRIHVERVNPAKHLYDRLGFTVITDKPFHYEMLWKDIEHSSAS